MRTMKAANSICAIHHSAANLTVSILLHFICDQRKKESCEPPDIDGPSRNIFSSAFNLLTKPKLIIIIVAIDGTAAS